MKECVRPCYNFPGPYERKNKTPRELRKKDPEKPRTQRIAHAQFTLEYTEEIPRASAEDTFLPECLHRRTPDRAEIIIGNYSDR